ncbi:bile acid:sodium symporter family protein [Neiella marina]|uniref:Bile acid:sodium symporter family protein n=1 Tax=Neiella holothuriorum TaxID=2870530 RepID=A0ABS7EBB1_9GAMM|nr:bile acid:sodium symporter family protein [Neiella holothuriorum]MBW8189624.1 bile acid:sodium symporter family protein [Neiella holothuriorum]
MSDALKKPLLLTSLAGLVAGAALFVASNQVELAGIVITLSLLLLAFGVKLTQHFNNMTFTVYIFAAVSASMFFPQFFTHIGDFKLDGLIGPLLMIIMFGMGCSLSWRDFSAVIKAPKAVIIGVLCQFTIMPIIGLSLALMTGLPPEIAAGIILVGCSPSGMASNVMAYISGANLALSLTLTSVATLLAPLMTPLLMSVLADQFVEIDPLAMLWSIVKMVILPIIAGVLVNHFFKNNSKLINKVMPFVSMAAIALIITVITATGRDSLLTIGGVLIIAVIAHNILGYILGYTMAKVAGMDEASARSVSFEVGMQNGGLASGLAVAMGKVATMGLAPAVFGPVMNISGSALAAFWRKKTPVSQPAENAQPEQA